MEADIVVAGLEDEEEQGCGHEHRARPGGYSPVRGPPR